MGDGDLEKREGGKPVINYPRLKVGNLSSPFYV